MSLKENLLPIFHNKILSFFIVVRRFQDFEAPFLTIKLETGTCRVAVRKT